MAAIFPAQVSALEVGSYFVGQYYILLQQDPSLVHRFYSEVSTMNRFDGTRAESAAGMMQIHNLIARLNYTGVEIKSANSLESWNGGILVMVSGSIRIKEYFSLRKFAQTFFLAPQENGYFVLNDIFQFVDDEQVHQHPKATLAHPSYESTIVAHHPITETAVSGYTLGEGTQKRSYGSPISMEQTETVDKYSIHDPHQQVQLALNPNTTTTDIARDPPLTPERPVGEPAKHTYASILRVAKAQSGQASPHNAPLNKTSNKSSDWQLAQQGYQQSQSATKDLSENSNAEAVASVDIKDEGEPKSVYVWNLPSSITTSQLEKEFKKFGELKPEGIIIRSRKETGVFYAFIEFDDATGVMNAIKASPVQVSGRLVHVEERRPINSSYRGGGRVRGRGRGRGRGGGGYHYDAPRGRFGNRFHGRGGYENTNRDYNSRPRGRGYHRRVSNQEMGILGDHTEQEQTE